MHDNSPTTVTLVRHGHIVNDQDVFHGRLPGFPLSAEGRRQARAAAALLQGRQVTAVYASPMQRARQTAHILHAEIPIALPVYVTELLHEIDSPYDGASREAMQARNWDFYSDVGPPWEQPDDILRRVHRFFLWMQRAHPGEHVLGVSHADPIAFAIMWAHGWPLEPARRSCLDRLGLADAYPATASLSTFIFDTAKEHSGPAFLYERPW